jgi:Fe-S-cluster containining protein
MRLYQIEKQNEYLQNRTASDAVWREYEEKCQSCGACCSFYAWFPMRMQVDDGPLIENETLTFKAKETTKVIDLDGTSYKTTSLRTFFRRRKIDGWWRCIALEGNVGQSVKCTVYKDRPSGCSGFVPGSELCKRARRWAGLESQV